MLDRRKADRRLDEQTDRFPLCSTDFVPLGAAAPHPLNLNHILLKQGTGTADHLLPLGCYHLFYDFISLTSLLLPKLSGDLKYGPCPLARDFGSRVSGLVYHNINRSTDARRNEAFHFPTAKRLLRRSSVFFSLIPKGLSLSLV